MTATDDCPKHMAYGPCGGVHPDHRCEVDARRCPFVGRPLAPTPRRDAVPLPFDTSGRALLVDVRAPRDWRGDARRLWRDTAAVLDGCVALLGEHVDNPVLADDAGSVPPEEVVEILAAAGVAPVVTVTGRDRDVRAATRLVERLRDAGAAAIHCVTGDHPRALGLDRAVWFGAEAMTLVAAAADAGIAATVGESPASPGPRVERLRAKVHAGASGCILNHAGAPGALIAFADEVAHGGSAPALFAPVPMVAGAQSARALVSFPGSCLPPGYLDAILHAEDPEREGVRAAAALARVLCASGRFAGLDLSGGGHRADPYERLAMTARYIEAVRDA